MTYKDHLCDDCADAMQQSNHNIDPTPAMVYSLELARLSSILVGMGTSLHLAGLPGVDYWLLTGYMHLTGSEAEIGFMQEDSQTIFNDHYLKMNAEKKAMTETVINALYKDRSCCFFLDRPGGTHWENVCAQCKSSFL